VAPIDTTPGLVSGIASGDQAAVRRVPTSSRARRSLSRRSSRAGMLLVLPAVALIVAFVLFPLGFAVYVSLTNWPLIGPYHYIGLTNYRELYHDQAFRDAIRFTVTYTAIVTPPIFFVGYGLAMLVRANRPGVKLFRTLFFLPFVVGLTTASYLFSIELQPNSGAVDYVLSTLGLASDSQPWTVGYHTALIAISAIVVWFASGLTMLILLGGMQSIPRELHEAAEVDGASWLERELRITLPLLRRSIALSLIISVIGSFLAFNQFFILAQNNYGLETVVELVYQAAFTQYHLAYGTAMALLLVVVIGLVSAVQLALFRDSTEM
jgi:multiple sugar transport system permease protein